MLIKPDLYSFRHWDPSCLHPTRFLIDLSSYRLLKCSSFFALFLALSRSLSPYWTVGCVPCGMKVSVSYRTAMLDNCRAAPHDSPLTPLTGNTREVQRYTVAFSPPLLSLLSLISAERHRCQWERTQIASPPLPTSGPSTSGCQELQGEGRTMRKKEWPTGQLTPEGEQWASCTSRLLAYKSTQPE